MGRIGTSSDKILNQMSPPYSPKNDNVAGRLWNILTAAQKLTGGTTHQQLAKAFQLASPSDTALIVRTLVAAAEGVDKIEWRIRRIPGKDYDLYLHSLPHIKEGFIAATSNRDFNQWKTAYMKAEHIGPLMYCAQLISEFYPEEEINQDELQQFLKRVDALYESVLASHLEPNIKLLILDQLQNIRQAIHEYRIKGVYILSEALERATGAIALHKAEIQEAVEQEDGDKIKDFIDKLTVLDKIISIAKNSKQLFLPLLPFVPVLIENARAFIAK